VQRELVRLAESGLVTVTRVGTQKHYQANPKSPIYAELCAIAQKTVGLAEPLRNPGNSEISPTLASWRPSRARRVR
jgi:hypothetical protein